ncbi:unnamed protein product [Trifolium pratense]|uniref:Uncharacterized protein n=1 Tax=Trifolium pratense TaxID=57577 RepID=A0ACB0L636_TRIPR|nr:unnamed protein product [Trifolium pratense]
MRPVQPWKEVYKWTTYYMNAMQNKVMHNSNSTASVCVSIAWKPPINGWVCLNTDGASKDNQVGGCGGLIRECQGNWCGGFSKKLGNCSAYEVELWGVYEGLRLAWERGFKKVELRVDSMVVAYTLKNGSKGSVVGWRLVQQIRRFLELDWEIKICHSYREANKCADALANIGCQQESTLMIYEHCLAQLSSLLLADVMEIATPRLIVV